MKNLKEISNWMYDLKIYNEKIEEMEKHIDVFNNIKKAVATLEDCQVVQTCNNQEVNEAMELLRTVCNIPTKKKYPMMDQDEENVKDGLYIALHHGFKNEEEREEENIKGNWGVGGPLIGPLSYVHTAYQGDCNYCFENEERAEVYDMEYEGFLKYNNSCIIFDGIEYGEMTILCIKNEKTKKQYTYCDYCQRAIAPTKFNQCPYCSNELS